MPDQMKLGDWVPEVVADDSNDNLQTPPWVTNALGPFHLDPCAGQHTNIASINWWDGDGHDGLATRWDGLVWCNCPFSEKELWIAKMLEHRNGIMLLPERGSAPWFGPFAMAAGEYFVMGRKINFIGATSSNNVGSVLFPFGDVARERVRNSGLPGHLVKVQSFTPRAS